ncbi:putative sodium/proton antiporter [Microlunatus phosphovorus NM-1]|uniref:Na(+)/H(+) antiporter NhaA n=1 Tax=Microlunatus phosphovorus (strain ATCC 700054 / DSM 10555 / JCM 9379 / NBRC 101784 / NCIMB 13414 / VKM Ac-1990 / NM-1) TaxID=1032480 RepID=F5XP28_MICPN|nr:Na+/H+ antiporter NhaA [Microlunatus phosphovorus]BAK36668.1 putative sodium/proton antiporter [Microlunatus phosphovorus NM-1]
MPGSSGLLLRLRTRSQTVTGRISAALSRIAENTVQSAAILVAATLLAVVWVNSPFGDTYDEFWHLKAGFVLGPYELILDLKHWVNDGLMALFFFTIGLEVKRELAIGELTDRRRAAVPIVAAVAGLLLPALIFLAFNAGTAAAHAWGVVVSTDTAFVLALLALVGPKPGTRLRLFLVTLAVADDIGALTIIAFFYTESLSWGWLGLALLGLAVVGLLRWLRVRRDGAYLAVGILTWIAAYQSGVHATLAGVAIALILPVYPPKREAVERVEEVTRAFRQSPSAEYERLARRQITSSVAINERLQVLLRPFVALVVLPLFALANAGVSLSGESLAAAATSRLTWGVIAGLVVGKLVGVLLGARLAARTPWAELPPGLTHKQLAGGAALAGIGFTISLFIVDLALDDPALQDQARVGVFAASLIAAGLGALSFYLGRADAALSGPPVELLRPVDPDRDHIRGRVDAPLTLVEYADFECPFCSKATGSIAELREWLGDDLRYVFRHLPMEQVHPHARAAALASEAAAVQGRFWELADRMFAHSDALEPDDLREYAADIGLDLERFDEDLRTRRYEKRVDDDAIDAETSEVHGTPTFYVNGRRHLGPYDAQTLAMALVDSAPEADPDPDASAAND